MNVTNEEIHRLYAVMHAAKLLVMMNDGPRDEYYKTNIDFVWHLVWNAVQEVEAADAFAAASTP